MVQTVGQTTGIPQLLHTVIDVPVLQVFRFSSCAWTRWLMPQLAGRACLRSPVVTPRQIPMVSLTMEIPQFFIDKVIDESVFIIFSQDKVLQRFVEQIVDDDKEGWTWFNSVSWSRTSKHLRRSCGSLTWVWWCRSPT